MTKRRKIFFLPVSAVAIVLAVASFAFACTDVQGTAQITKIKRKPAVPTACATNDLECASSGDTLTVKGTGARRYVAGTTNVIRYYLYFLNYSQIRDGMDTCMPPPEDASATGEPMLIGGPARADASGNIPETEGVLPLAGPTGNTQSLLGPGWVCFMGGGWEENDTVERATNDYLSRVGAQNATTYDTLNVVMI